MWLSFSPDLKHWGDHRLLVKTRHAYWDGHRVGLACQPIEIPQGWMVFYHGVRVTSAGAIYRLGLVLPVAMAGGVAKNRGVVRAIENEVGEQLIVPSEPQIVGALGAALLAADDMTGTAR